MEYLVTMTTHVPAGVPEEEVADVRAREAAHSAELALDGRLLRLWRPPLRPGEWRSLGLFAAGDQSDLHRTLASMPLRIWRTDEVITLGRHPNDPGPGRTALDLHDTEFLTTFVLRIPAGTSSAAVDRVAGGEAARTRELAGEGRLIRLWTLAGQGRALGHRQARDDRAMQGVLQSLPMSPWLTVGTVALTRHPSDPATTASLKSAAAR